MLRCGANEDPPFVRSEDSRRGGVIDILHFRFVGGKAPFEVLREAHDVSDRRAIVDLRKQVARQLPQLHPFEAQLPLRVPSRDARSKHRGQQGFLLGLRPAPQTIMKVRQSEPVGFHVAPIERVPEVVEPLAERSLCAEQLLQPDRSGYPLTPSLSRRERGRSVLRPDSRQIPASPGSIRV